MKATIPYGPLAVDQATFRNPGVIKALNVIPRTGSYGPLRELTAFSQNALGGRCYGGISARSAANNVYVYAADSNKLYEMAGDDSFVDVAKGTSYTALASSDTWEFVQWNRNQKIIATNYQDNVQSVTIGTAQSADFADMMTSTLKPKARHVGIVGQFVVLGSTNDATDGEKISRVWWSGFGDETDFDPAASTQCDYEDLSSGGIVQRVIGGADYGLVFQQSMVRTMRYVGAGVVFELYPINYAPGTPIPTSVVAHKGSVYYIAEDGFFSITGGQVVPIGTARIDKKFWREFEAINKVGVSAAIDPLNKIVMWAYPSGSTTLADKILMFKWDEGKWSEGEVDIELLLSTETNGYSLDGLDAVGTDIDNATVFPVSFDSDIYRGGAFKFGAFNSSHTLAHFVGATRKAVIETGDIQPQNGQRWQLNGVRPLVDGGEVDVTVSSRTRIKDSVSYGTGVGMNTDGLCQVRAEGRYNRIRVSLTSSTSWSHIQGFEMDYEIEGER